MSAAVRDRGLKMIDQDMKRQVKRLKDGQNYETATRLTQVIAELKENLEISSASSGIGQSGTVFLRTYGFLPELF